VALGDAWAPSSASGTVFIVASNVAQPPPTSPMPTTPPPTTPPSPAPPPMTSTTTPRPPPTVEPSVTLPANDPGSAKPLPLASPRPTSSPGRRGDLPVSGHNLVALLAAALDLLMLGAVLLGWRARRPA